MGRDRPRLIALLERQLDRIGGGDPARRVRILATLATELNSDETAVRGWGYGNEALDTARRLGQPEELGIAVSAYLFSAGELTDHVPQIRAVLYEMLQGSHPDLAPQVQAILTECCYRAQLNLITDDREPGRFLLDSCRMLLTGTLADHAEEMAARLDRPGHPSIPHLAAPAAALGFAQRGDLERARQIATRWFAPPPRSFTWMQAISYWAQVAAILGVPDPGWLYDQLAPHAGELAIVGMATDGGGAVDSLLAGLPLHLGRLDEAAGRAQTGLALETRVGSLVWINRTTDLINRIGAARGHAPSRDQSAVAAHAGTVPAAEHGQR